MLSGAREAGCFREVAALHSDHLRQVPLYVHTLYVCIHVCVCVYKRDKCHKSDKCE